MSWILYLLTGYVLAIILPTLETVLPGLLKSKISLFVAAWLAAGFYFLQMDSAQVNLPWATEFGLALSFKRDGLAQIFSSIILLVGVCVYIYATEYMKSSDRRGRFFLAYTLFITSMLGLVTADNFFLAFIFWELTSFTSYLLIGYYHEKDTSRASALQALLVTGMGGLILFAGLLILQNITGANSFSQLYELKDQLSQIHSPLILWAIACILIGGFTKSAQFPFHFWLPNAMAAPAPVSALLHSATMVKAGIFLFLRLDPLFNDINIWSNSLLIVGAATLLLGAYSSFKQKDKKKILAYTTIGTLGALTFLIGLQHPMDSQVALVLFIAHALYKATLFMIAGIIEKTTGTRDLTKVRGLRKTMPLVFLASCLAALSMIGVPPFLGFLSKEVILKILVQEAWALPIWIVALTLMGAAAWLVGIKPFLGKEKKPVYEKPSFLFSLGPLILSIAGIILSFDPTGWLQRSLKTALFYEQKPVPLHLWAGINGPLILSLIIIGLVAVAVNFYFRFYIPKAKEKNNSTAADQIYESVLTFILEKAKKITRLIQNGSLSSYVMLAFTGLLCGAGSIYLSRGVAFNFLAPQKTPGLEHIGLGIIILTCLGLVALSESKVTAIVAHGGIGFSLAAFFAMLGAPDLSLTQIIVEILSVILFVFLLKENFKLKPANYKKSQYKKSKWPIKTYRALIAVGTGVLVALLTWQSHTHQLSSPISDYFAKNSYVKAFGKNVVNVILVDFRGFDTFGEIIVLAVTAVTLSVLLKWKRGDEVVEKNKIFSKDLNRILVKAATKWLFPIFILSGIYFLLRGHNLPGGGFIGGLIFGSAFVLRYISHPTDPNHYKIFFLTTEQVISAGLIIALFSGFLALLNGDPYMTGVWHIEIWAPLVGKIKTGSPFYFDIGVFLVVIGMINKIFLSFEADQWKS